MTLQLLHSEFSLYEENFVFFWISVACWPASHGTVHMLLIYTPATAFTKFLYPKSVTSLVSIFLRKKGRGAIFLKHFQRFSSRKPRLTLAIEQGRFLPKKSFDLEFESFYKGSRSKRVFRRGGDQTHNLSLTYYFTYMLLLGVWKPI